MSDFSQRLHWIFIGRRLASIGLPGFWASIWSYADQACKFSPDVKIYRDARLLNATLGRMTYVAEGARLGYCEIGAYSSIGPQSLIGGLGKHPTQLISTHPAFYSTLGQAGRAFAKQDQFHELQETVLGNDVWVGARAVILDGCRIGNGAIVAAGALVTKDVPAYTIVGGVPAKPIRLRFSQEVITEFLAWGWWDLPEEILAVVANEFCKKTDWNVQDITQLREVTERLVSARHPTISSAVSNS